MENEDFVIGKEYFLLGVLAPYTCVGKTKFGAPIMETDTGFIIRACASEHWTEVKKKVSFECWTNVYEHYNNNTKDTMITFPTKERADFFADRGRIACVKLTGEYEV